MKSLDEIDGHKQIGVQDFFSFSADLIGVSKIGHQLMKLGVNSQDLQDFIMLRLDVMKNMISSEGVVGKGKSKVGLKLVLYEREPVYWSRLTFDFIPSFHKTGAPCPQFGVLCG